MKTKNVKTEILKKIDQFLNNNQNPFDSISGVTRYLSALISILNSNGVKNIKDYMLKSKALISQISTPHFSVSQHLIIYKYHKQNPYFFEQLVYLSDKLKSKNINEALWEALLSYIIPNRVNRKVLFQYFYIIARLSKLGAFENKNSRQLKNILAAVFNLEFLKQDTDLCIPPMEKKVSVKYRELFRWITKLIKTETSSEKQANLIIRLIVLNSTETNYKRFFLKLNKLQITKVLEKYYSCEIILYTSPEVLEKFAELYKNAPVFFDRQKFFETNWNKEYDFVLRRFFKEYKISEVFLTNLFKLNKFENQWLIHLLNGKSIISAPNLPLALTKKAIHVFRNLSFDGAPKKQETPCLSAPYGFTSVGKALIYSSLLANGVSVSYAKSVTSNRNITAGENNIDYWIKWMSYLYKKGLKDNSVDAVMNYLYAKTFCQRQAVQLKGKKISNLLANINAWHDELGSAECLKYHAEINFMPLDIKEYVIEKNKEKFVISQILSSKELYLEGKNLHHCVFSYKNQCLNLDSAIFSLRKVVEENNVKRLITIEVKNKIIYQTKGSFNRNPSREETEIIKHWAKEENLIYSAT